GDDRRIAGVRGHPVLPADLARRQAAARPGAAEDAVLRAEVPHRSADLEANSIVILFAVAIVVVGLWAFFKFTRIGVGVRAAAENSDRAKLLGISTGMLSSIVWMLATVLSSLGMFLRIPVIGLPIGADVGPFVLLFGLSAAVIGKLDNFFVAAMAAIWLSIL